MWRGYKGFEGRSASRSWLYKNGPRGPRHQGPVHGAPRCPRTFGSNPARTGLPWARTATRLMSSWPAKASGWPPSPPCNISPAPSTVLVLRYVLWWESKEVAELLDVSVISVNGVLQRAKKTLGARGVRPGAARPSAPRSTTTCWPAMWRRSSASMSRPWSCSFPMTPPFRCRPMNCGCKALPRCVTGWPLTRAGVRTSSPSRPTAPPVTRCTGSRPDCAKNDRQHGD